MFSSAEEQRRPPSCAASTAQHAGRERGADSNMEQTPSLRLESHRSISRCLALLLAASSLGIAATGDAATCSQVSISNITYQFDASDGEPECGQFITGDWWVVAPVTVTRITPDHRSNCGSSGNLNCNGWEVNPIAYGFGAERSAFDERSFAWQDSLMPSLPYSASAGDSIVKVKSWNPNSYGPGSQCGPSGSPPDDDYSCIDDVAILTVLAAAPPADAFRPPYVAMAAGKRMHTLAESDLSDWPNLATLPGNAPSPTTVRSLWGCPILDHWVTPLHRNFHGKNCIVKPNGNAADYDAEISMVTSMTALRTMHGDLQESEKRELLIPLVQFGIDLYYMLAEYSPNMHWAPWGGYGSGRKLPILLAGRFLRNDDMLGIGTTYGGPPAGWSCSKYFGEDGQTYYGEGGVALFGQADDYTVCGCSGKFGGNPGYDEHIGSCNSQPNVCRDPDGLRDGDVFAVGSANTSCRKMRTPAEQIADGNWEAGAYQWCCTSNPWIGTQISALLLGFKSYWNHDAFFDYVDRWASPPWNAPGAFGDGYLESMYQTYREAVPGPWTPPDGPPVQRPLAPILLPISS